jgi:hypothetical protein
MVRGAFNWIRALSLAWKVAASVCALVLFVGTCGASIAKVQYDSALRDEKQDSAAKLSSEIQDRRITSLEKHDEIILKQIVVGLNNLDDAQSDALEAEHENTSTYREDMRTRLRDVENTMAGMKATLEQIDKRIP